jgi:predicted DNA-binding transcriptional regulator AlpA
MQEMTMTPQPRDRILTATEAAERLRLSVRTLDRMAATDGGLKKIQLSTRRIGYRESDVERLIEHGSRAA